MGEELLISLVHQYECLYNLQHKDYDNNVVKNNIWREIGKSMNLTGEVLDLGTMPTLFSGGSGINVLCKILKTVEMMKMDISHQSQQIEEILQRLKNKGKC